MKASLLRRAALKTGMYFGAMSLLSLTFYLTEIAQFAEIYSPKKVVFDRLLMSALMYVISL